MPTLGCNYPCLPCIISPVYESISLGLILRPKTPIRCFKKSDSSYTLPSGTEVTRRANSLKMKQQKNAECEVLRISLVSVLYQPCISLVSALYQPCISLVSVLYQPCISLVSVLYQPCISLVSALYQSCISLLSALYQSCQPCFLLVIRQQHTEEEMPLPCQIINGRRLCRGKDRLFLFPFSDNFWSQTWRWIFFGGEGVGKAHKTFPHGVSVTRESLSGLKVKTKWVSEGTRHNAMCLPACLIQRQ